MANWDVTVSGRYGGSKAPFLCPPVPAGVQKVSNSLGKPQNKGDGTKVPGEVKLNLEQLLGHFGYPYKRGNRKGGTGKGEWTNSLGSYGSPSTIKYDPKTGKKKKKQVMFWVSAAVKSIP